MHNYVLRPTGRMGLNMQLCIFIDICIIINTCKPPYVGLHNVRIKKIHQILAQQSN